MKALEVVNNCVKGVVALVKKYNYKTANENQTQAMLEVVPHHRKQLPKRTKAASNFGYSNRLISRRKND